MLIAQTGIGAAGIHAYTGEQRWYVEYPPKARHEPFAVTNLAPTTTGDIYAATNENGAIHLVGIGAKHSHPCQPKERAHWIVLRLSFRAA